MKSEIKQIEDRIRRILSQEGTDRITKRSIKQRLSSLGFKISDIETALNRVWGKRKSTQKAKRIKLPKTELSTLVLCERDLRKFSDEGYQGLQRLYNFRILDDEDWALVFQMIDRSWGKIDLEKLVSVLINALGDKYSYEALRVILGVAVGDDSVFC